MKTPEKGIPRDLLNKAVCVGVIPSERKLALGIGGSYGRGILVCGRGGNGRRGGPSMFTVGGVNMGFQLGDQATDFVLVIMNSKGAKKLRPGSCFYPLYFTLRPYLCRAPQQEHSDF